MQREDHIVHFRDLLTFSLASNDVTMNRSDRDALMGALSALNWVLRPAQPARCRWTWPTPAGCSCGGRRRHDAAVARVDAADRPVDGERLRLCQFATMSCSLESRGRVRHYCGLPVLVTLAGGQAAAH